MPVSDRTVADVINDAYRMWRGEATTEASDDERAAMRRTCERGARIAYRRYPFYFNTARTTGVVSSSTITIPAAASQIIGLWDANGVPVGYRQTGTTVVTLLDDSITGTLTIEYKTNVPVYGTAETESVPTEIYDFLVVYTFSECWRLDKQYSKAREEKANALELLVEIMSEIENQRGLKRRPAVRTYRGKAGHA